MADHISENDNEHDEYSELLARLGRTYNDEVRVASHELGHFFLDRICGKSGISAVSITPRDGYEGICFGARHTEAFVKNDRLDAADLREILEPSMPQPGEDGAAVADIFQSTLDAVTELMAGEAAEKIVLGNANLASDDRRQARELASLICKSLQAVERFLSFCEQQAHDLLAPYATVLMSAQIILRIRRDMSGEELDRVIGVILAEQAAAVERRRRADWRKREVSASRFPVTEQQ